MDTAAQTLGELATSTPTASERPRAGAGPLEPAARVAALALAVLFLVVAVLVGDLRSAAPVLPRPVGLVALVASLGAGALLVRSVGMALVTSGRWALVSTGVTVFPGIVLLSFPKGGGLALFFLGVLLVPVPVVSALVVGIGGPRRRTGLLALAVEVLAVTAVFAATDATTDLRLRLVASRYRQQGDALLIDPPDDSQGYEWPTVGRSSPDGEPEAVTWVWAEGLLGNGAGVVYVPSGRDPSHLQFGIWAATTCERRLGADVWWCGFT